MTFPCDTEHRWAIGHFLVARTGRGNDDANRKQPQPAQGLEGLRRGGTSVDSVQFDLFCQCPAHSMRQDLRRVVAFGRIFSASLRTQRPELRPESWF